MEKVSAIKNPLKEGLVAALETPAIVGGKIYDWVYESCEDKHLGDVAAFLPVTFSTPFSVAVAPVVGVAVTAKTAVENIVELIKESKQNKEKLKQLRSSALAKLTEEEIKALKIKQ